MNEKVEHVTTLVECCKNSTKGNVNNISKDFV